MPRTITKDDLLRIYSPDLPRELKFGLDQILVNRELDMACQDEALLQQLSSRCVFV